MLPGGVLFTTVPHQLRCTVVASSSGCHNGDGHLPGSEVWKRLYGAGVPRHRHQNGTCLCFPQTAFYILAKTQNTETTLG